MEPHQGQLRQWMLDDGQMFGTVNQTPESMHPQRLIGIERRQLRTCNFFDVHGF
jgi:hypothetical protein